MSTPPPPPPPTPPVGTQPRRLVRLTDQGKVAGVAAGIGWYFGVDPVLVRIALVVLTIGTGLGIPAYIAAWVLLPKAQSGQTPLPAPPRQRDGRTLAIVGIGIIAAVALIGQVDLFSGQTLTAAICIGIAVLLFTDGSRQPAGTAPTPPGPPPSPPAPMPPGATATATAAAAPPTPGTAPPVSSPPGPQAPPEPDGPPAGPGPRGPSGPGGQWGPGGRWGPGGQWGPGGRWGRQGWCGPQGEQAPPSRPESAYQPYAAAWRPEPPGRDPGRPDAPRASRPRSVLGRLTFGVWLAVMGIATLLNRIDVVDLTPLAGVALTVAVVGSGLLVGTFFGRARALIPLGVLAVLLLIPLNVFATQDVDVNAGVGERTYTPTAVEDVAERYDLFAGAQQIDLTQLDLSGETVEVDASTVLGEVLVLVPDDVDVTVSGSVAAGEHTVLDDPKVGGTDLTIDARQDGEGDGAIQLNVDAVLGSIVVQPVERS